MFHDNTFDKWLDSRVQDILNKAQNSSLSDSEMLTLVLKSQTNHFHHLDIEFRDEFKRFDNKFETEFKRLDNKFEDKFKQLDDKFEIEFKRVDKRFDQLRDEIKESFHRHDLAFEKHDYIFEKIDQRFKEVDQRFERVDQRFIEMDKKIDSRFLWTIGIMISGFAGIYLKLIFP